MSTQDVTEEAPFPFLLQQDEASDTSNGKAPARKKNIVGQVLDLLALALLGLAILTAALAGYQAITWSSHSQLRYHEASAQLGHANIEMIRATQMMVSEVANGATTGDLDASMDLRTRLAAAATASEAGTQVMAEASEADDVSTRFVLAAVFFTVVLFLTGVATVLRQPPLKGMLLGAALGVHGASILYLLFLPFTW